MAWDPSGVPGGGTTRTSWFERDLPAMWRVLENQQSDDHWRLVAGWRKAAELTASHLHRLRQYRANLVEAWPPDRNAAAAAYVARLDFLIDSVRTTYDVAAANYSTLAATVGALALARQELRPLHEEWLAKSRAIKNHADLAALNAAAEGPTVIGAPPAGAGDLERLNNRARAIMYTLSHTLVEAEAAIRQPPTYASRTRSSPIDPDVYGESTTVDTQSKNPTVLPGIASAVRDDSFQRSLGEGMSTRLTQTVTPAVDPNALSRRGTVQPTTPPRKDLSAAWDADTIGVDGYRKTEGPPVLPAGGVIGPIPADDERPSPTRSGTRVGPVGGVIDSTHLGGQILNGNGPPLAVGVPASQRDQPERTVTRRYAETVWPLHKGVPPVITPPPRNEVEPGPVIGLNQ